MKQRWTRPSVLLVLSLLVGGVSHPGAVFGQAASACRSVRVNYLGVDRAPITVSNTVVTVAEPNTSRCQLLIANLSDNDMVCADVSKDPVPTASTGMTIGQGSSLVLGPEGQGRWQCIRAGDTDATATVAEALP